MVYDACGQCACGHALGCCGSCRMFEVRTDSNAGCGGEMSSPKSPNRQRNTLPTRIASSLSSPVACISMLDVNPSCRLLLLGNGMQLLQCCTRVTCMHLFPHTHCALRAAQCLPTNNNNEYDACGKCVCSHALGCRMLEILMDSDPLPAGTLWRRSELMIIQAAQPTTEILSLDVVEVMYVHVGSGA